MTVLTKTQTKELCDLFGIPATSVKQISADIRYGYTDKIERIVKVHATFCVAVGEAKQPPKKPRIGHHSRHKRGSQFLVDVALAYNKTVKGLRDEYGVLVPRDTQAAQILATMGYVDDQGLPFGAAWLRRSKANAVERGHEITVWRAPKGKGKK